MSYVFLQRRFGHRSDVSLLRIDSVDFNLAESVASAGTAAAKQ
jgi:hypothetical protein